MFFSKPITIATHNGSFHADDVFACVTLLRYYQQQGKKVKIIRTRDQDQIDAADVVVDVGGVYDITTKRFDHHQSKGAGKRENGIPYASFGLVWKSYGLALCGSEEIVEDIDRRLVQPIDAIDNGVSISESIECGLYDYGIHGIVSAYQCTWKEAGETEKQYDNFMALVSFFSDVLSREIEKAHHRLEMVALIEDIYTKASYKDIIEVPYHVTIGSLMQVLEPHKEVQFVICKSNTNWKALALRKEACSFENRTSLPEAWAGKRNEELQQLSSVDDALFCHNALFMAVAKSKEGAWKLAQFAVAQKKAS